MRNATKSFVRFSFAMTALGARQMVRLFERDRGLDHAANSFDAVTHAAESQLDDTARGLYKAGDHLQSGMVDAVAALVSRAPDPRDAMSRMREAVERSVDATRDAFRSAKDDVSDAADAAASAVESAVDAAADAAPA
ncbi:MAG: hypothetical protein AAF772_17580 [Acidobacteriota bacterium]